MTLVEVTIVGVLAMIVVLALTGFYINSQGTWIDASSQAVAQREATFIMETMADSTHASASADVATAHTLILFEPPPPYGTGTEKCRFLWNLSDSLIHQWSGNPFVDQGPLGQSKVVGFDVAENAGRTMVRILKLQVRSANGRVITMSTNAAYFNQ